MAKPLQGREITAVNVPGLGWGTVRWEPRHTRIRCATTMRATNLHFTYLLTYLLTYITTLDMFCPAFVSE